MALKVADVAPAATVTDVGVVSDALSLDSATEDPPAGAALVKVTVQVLAAPETRLVGLQATAETRTGATRLMVAVWEELFRVAVTVAL